MIEQATVAESWMGFFADCVPRNSHPDDVAFLRAAFYSGAQTMLYRLIERSAEDAPIDDLMAEMAAFRDELLAAADCDQ